MWLRDTGMLDKMKWKNRVEDGRMDPYIPDPKVRVGKPLDITELGAAIFIEIGGVAIALLAFFVEICSSMSCFGKNMSQVIIIKVCGGFSVKFSSTKVLFRQSKNLEMTIVM